MQKGPWMAMGRKGPFFGWKFPRNIHGLWCLWWFLLSWSTAKFVHVFATAWPGRSSLVSARWLLKRSVSLQPDTGSRLQEATSGGQRNQRFFPKKPWFSGWTWEIFHGSAFLDIFVDLTPNASPNGTRSLRVYLAQIYPGLVLSAPLKNISQLFTLFPIYRKIKTCAKPPTSIICHGQHMSPTWKKVVLGWWILDGLPVTREIPLPY